MGILPLALKKYHKNKIYRELNKNYSGFMKIKYVN